MAEGRDSPEELLPFHLCDDLVCCVVCYEPFTEDKVPKALPCLHSFCKTCLAACIQSYQNQKRQNRARHSDKKTTKGEFPCPICKDVTRIPSNGLDGFRDDFRIRRISEVITKSRELIRMSSSDNLIDNQSSVLSAAASGEDKEQNGMCDVCKTPTDKTEKQYCLDCFKILCKDCASSHQLAALTSDHKLVGIPETGEKIQLPFSSTCPLHTSEPLLYYCRDCKHALCVTCSMGADHKQHEMIRLSDEVASMRQTITESLSSAWRQVSETDAQLEEIPTLEKDLQAKVASVKKAILSKTLEEVFRARQRQHRMEQDLADVCSEKTKSLRSRQESYKDFVESARSQCAFVENIITHGQDLHVVYALKEYLPSIDSLVSKHKPTVSSLQKITDLGKYDTLLTELYDTKESNSEDSQESILAEIRAVVSEIRQLSTTQGKSQPKATTSTSKSETRPQPKPKPKIELVQKIGRKGDQEGEFSFPSGITFLPSGELAVADMHNHRIQVFDPRGQFCRTFSSPGLKPCGITLTHDHNLAVTDCATGKSGIKVFTPEGQLKLTLAENQMEYPFSIAIDSNRRYVVCDSATNRIVVLKENGDLNRRFTTRTKFAFYLTINAKDEIFLSDWFNHCIKVFDTNGGLLRTIGSKGSKDGQIMIPLGLCPDNRGNILILDCKCGRVSQFTPDGKFLRHVIGQNEGIEYSRAIAVSGNCMFAISSGDNRGNIPNEVRLYKMND